MSYHLSNMDFLYCSHAIPSELIRKSRLQDVRSATYIRLETRSGTPTCAMLPPTA